MKLIEAEPPGGIHGSADDALPAPIIEITDLLSKNRLYCLYEKCDSDCANSNYQLGIWAQRKARLSSTLSSNWSLVNAASKADSEHLLVFDRSKYRA